MALSDEMERQGAWLFKWRSFLPLLMLPILVVAVAHSNGLEKHVGRVADGIFEGCCVLLSFAGLAVRCLTVGFISPAISTRNRNVGQTPSLRTTGTYSLVRHPLYLGNFLILLGIAVFTGVWWFVVIAVLAFWLYYERIMFAEENALLRKFGDVFAAWSARTPAFIPRFSNWERPAEPFYFRSVLKKEYTGFLEITAAFAALELIKSLMVDHKLWIGPVWLVMLAVGLVTYVTLRTLKKTTRLLEAP